tara:strand:- start:19398 stop:19976 length:579 start_codon:yes stop_codon:yes gene_type:complete
MKTQDAQVYEILEELDSCTTKQRKVDLINTKYSNHTPLQYVLRWNFDRSIKSLLPEGEPPFDKERKDGDSPQALWSYLKMFPNFVDSAQGRQLPELKRENLFIEMLDALDLEEANVIVLAKDGKLDEKYNITIDVVNAAYPDIGLVSDPIPEPTPKEQKEDLLSQAKSIKEQVKELNSLAKELTEKAKAITE